MKRPMLSSVVDQALNSAVSLLLDHPDFRKEKIEAGYKKAAEFSWEKAARATEEVYRSVLNRKRGGRPQP